MSAFQTALMQIAGLYLGRSGLPAITDLAVRGVFMHAYVCTLRNLHVIDSNMEMLVVLTCLGYVHCARFPYIESSLRVSDR